MAPAVVAVACEVPSPALDGKSVAASGKPALPEPPKVGLTAGPPDEEPALVAKDDEKNEGAEEQKEAAEASAGNDGAADDADKASQESWVLALPEGDGSDGLIGSSMKCDDGREHPL